MLEEVAYKLAEEEKEPWWSFHSQNLNEDRDGNITGSILRHGRCWLRLGTKTLGWEWSIPSRFTHAEVSWGGSGDYDVSASLATPLCALWFHIESLIPWRVKKKLPRNHWWWQGRELGVSIHDQGIYVNICAPDDSWSADQPKWMHFVIHPLDILLGREEYACEVLETLEVDVPMPEGVYRAKVKKERSTWKRPRSPFVKERIGYDFDFHANPVPVPGRDDSDYCYDVDAIYGTGATADNIGDAIGKIVASVLKSRKRDGGSIDWQPGVKR